MKKFFTLIFILLMTQILNAQKNFEGKIVFSVISGDSEFEMKITAWFGTDKIKTVTEVIKRPDNVHAENETTILDFKNGVIDRIKASDKKIEREKLTRQDIPPLKPTNETSTILDRSCIGYTTGKINLGAGDDSAGAAVNEKEIKLWYAKDLFFAVPDSLKMMQMVPMFTDGHICLRSEMHFHSAGSSFVLKTEAREISPSQKSLPAGIFTYPVGYPLIHKD